MSSRTLWLIFNICPGLVYFNDGTNDWRNLNLNYRVIANYFGANGNANDMGSNRLHHDGF